MTARITTEASSRLELGVGAVVPGQEEWMYGTYFPAIGPVMASFGLRTLASFRVVETNLGGPRPVQGSLTSWPSSQQRAALQRDPRFVAIRPTRDAALSCLDDGHLFEPVDQSVDVATDSDYAILVCDPARLGDAAELSLPLASDSPCQDHAGRSLLLRPWDERAQALLEGPPEEALVYRVRFNPQQSG